MRGAQLMDMEPQNVEPCLSHRHQAGLGRVELEVQLLEDQADRVSRVRGLEFGPADKDQVIGLPEQFAQTGIARDPVPIQHVQVTGRQHGADDPTWRRPHLGRLPLALLHPPPR